MKSAVTEYSRRIHAALTHVRPPPATTHIETRLGSKESHITRHNRHHVITTFGYRATVILYMTYFRLSSRLNPVGLLCHALHDVFRKHCFANPEAASCHLQTKAWIFTARCYASAVLAMGLCPSVCPSVTSRCSTKTAKRRNIQTTPHDSPGILVSCCQRSPRNSTRGTAYGGAKCRWGGSKSATFDK